MSALCHPGQTASENWDEDFEFNSHHDRDDNMTGTSTRKMSKPNVRDELKSRTSTVTSNLTEDWDLEQDQDTPPIFSARPATSILEDKKNYQHAVDTSRSQLLNQWSDFGPSTPSKKRFQRPSITENWDDDFDVDSPPRRMPTDPLDAQSLRRPTSSPIRSGQLTRPTEDSENWDDDFEIPARRHLTSSPSSKRPRHEPYSDSSDSEGEFGNGDREEDRTVTARSRPRIAAISHITGSSGSSPPPPVPALPAALLNMGLDSPIEPFPRSPTGSVFSLPTSAGGHQDSLRTYSSTAHLALQPTLSGTSSALGMLPPAPPIHRERRRLRKKSRPPHLDYNIFEMDDRDSPIASPVRPLSPELEQQISPPASPEPLSVPASPHSKGLLLTRIGSVKKWGARRKRASTGPTDVLLQEGSSSGQGGQSDVNGQIPGSSAQPQQQPTKSSWFFRATGGGTGNGSSPPSVTKTAKIFTSESTFSKPRQPSELKHGKSVDKIRSLSQTVDPDSPSKLVKRKSLGFHQIRRQPPMDAGNDGGDEALDLTPRRPSSIQQIPRRRSHAAISPSPTPPPAFNRSASSSASLLNSSTENFMDGSRQFLGNMRKISLIGGKKSNGSSPKMSSPPSSTYFRTHDSLNVQDSPPVLPPIELRPPSPPNGADFPMVSTTEPTASTSNTDDTSPKGRGGIESTPRPRTSPAKTSPPQAASLGRSTISAAVGSPVVTLRRNSLGDLKAMGDLKIPARITQVQVSLRRDLGMVREFAASVEGLKELQTVHRALVSDVEAILSANQRPSRPPTSNFFNFPLPGSRHRSNTNPPPPQAIYKQIASTFYTINSKYRISWECADLLIELGGGTPASPPPVSVSAPAMQHLMDGRKSRERAMTLAGNESKPPSPIPLSPPLASPPNMGWRASTGRHDLSHRQLVLLKDMLNSSDTSVTDEQQIPEEPPHTAIDREWRWGDAMNSTVTLPSEDSACDPVSSPTKQRRRRSKLGMNGLRDALRLLKRHHTQQMDLPPQSSSVSLTTQSSVDSQARDHHWRQSRSAKTAAGPESIRSPSSQLASPPFLASTHKSKASPRRPSLASIFRVGHKSRTATNAASKHEPDTQRGRAALRQDSILADDEDWDRMDTSSDLDVPPNMSDAGPEHNATLRGRSPYLNSSESRPLSSSDRPQNGSHSSIWNGDNTLPTLPPRSTRLSNVDESTSNHSSHSNTLSKLQNTLRPGPMNASSSRTASRSSRIGSKSGSVRSAPPQPLVSGSFPDPKLAMTPDNIKPLLENAKEVQARLNDCIAEIRLLLTLIP